MEYLQIVPDFTGEQSTLSEFITISEQLIAQFYDCNKVNDFNNYILLRSIKNKIKGAAAVAISSYEVATWDDLKRALLATYGDKRDLQTLMIELCNLQQNKLKPLEFFTKVQENLNLQVSYIKNYHAEGSTYLIANSQKLALRVFLKHLNNPLSEYLCTRNPSTLNEALHILTNDYNITEKTQGTEPKPPLKQQTMMKQNYTRQIPPPINFPFNNPPQNYHPQPIQQYIRHPYPQAPQNSNVFRQGQPQYYKPTPMSIVTSNARPQHPSNNRNALPRIEEINLMNDNVPSPDTTFPFESEANESQDNSNQCTPTADYDHYFLEQAASEETHLNS